MKVCASRTFRRMHAAAALGTVLRLAECRLALGARHLGEQAWRMDDRSSPEICLEKRGRG
eukprot:scaffold6786_cov384-Prasinococcus_capsulatus_cf.AAC.3